MAPPCAASQPTTPVKQHAELVGGAALYQELLDTYAVDEPATVPMVYVKEESK